MMPVKELDMKLAETISNTVEEAENDWLLITMTRIEFQLDQCEQDYIDKQRKADKCKCPSCRSQAKAALDFYLEWFAYKDEMIEFIANIGTGFDEEEDFITSSAWNGYQQRKTPLLGWRALGDL